MSDAAMDETAELSLLLKQKCVIPVSFTDTTEEMCGSDRAFLALPMVGMPTENSTMAEEGKTFLGLPVELPVIGSGVMTDERKMFLGLPVDLPVTGSGVINDEHKTFQELPLPVVGSASGECVTAELGGCRTFLELPLELPGGASQTAESVKADLEGCTVLLGMPLVASTLTDLQNSSVFLDVPVAVPDAGSSAGEQMTFEFEGGRAEDTLREVSWLSDDQIEDMVRAKRHEKPPHVRSKRSIFRPYHNHRIRVRLLDDEDEEGVKDEVCATVKLNTSINRLTKFTILNPEDLPSVVMDYPPPREPRKLIWSETLVRESDQPVPSSTAPLTPPVPRPILLKRDESKLFPFSDEQASPVVLTRKRVRKHKKQTEV